MYNGVAMVTLGINTASSQQTLVLFSKGTLLATKTWRSASNETEVLLPTLTKLLGSAKLAWSDIRRVIVVCGPGPFSALRIGVTVGNMLAFLLRAKIFAIDTTTFWNLRYKGKIPSILLFHAGGNFVARSMKGENGVFPMNEALRLPTHLSANPLAFFGDLTENERRDFQLFKKTPWSFVPEEKLEPVSATFMKLTTHQLQSPTKKSPSVTPLYWRPPHITPSHKKTSPHA